MPRVSASSSLGALVAAVVVCAAPHTAWAQSARYELDSADSLIEDGWFYAHDGGTSSFSASLLRLQSTKGYNEFLLRNESDKPALTTGWVGTADPGRGWWVEARLSVAVATQCFGGGPGLSVDDGKLSIRLLFDTSGVHFTAPQTRDVAVPLTSNLHTYRVRSLGNRHVQLLIDGKLVDDEPVLKNPGSAKTLEFGDLGGCDATDATWDYMMAPMARQRWPASPPAAARRPQRLDHRSSGRQKRHLNARRHGHAEIQAAHRPAHDRHQRCDRQLRYGQRSQPFGRSHR